MGRYSIASVAFVALNYSIAQFAFFSFCALWMKLGRLQLFNTVSRRAPEQDVHWSTSYRLQSPNLVAVIKLPSGGYPMSPSMPLNWATVTYHDRTRTRRESDYRKQKRVCLDVVHQQEEISRGDSVAIIDCRSFAPEFLPVLDVLHRFRQRHLIMPFQEGRPFHTGTCASLCDTDQENFIATRLHSLQNCPPREGLKDLLHAAIASSNFNPLIEIRRQPVHLEKLVLQLSDLIMKSTLDVGQLKGFVGALVQSVHCIQGPPGTGKSFVGVAVVRALLYIRNIWKEVSPSAGTPPILVLSYKNHAIDEFLADLVKVERFQGKELMRIGGGCTEPVLQRFEEKFKRKTGSEILQDLSRKLKMLNAWLQDTSRRWKKKGMDLAMALEGLDHQEPASVDVVPLVRDIVNVCQCVPVSDDREDEEATSRQLLQRIINFTSIMNNTDDTSSKKRFASLYRGCDYAFGDLSESQLLLKWLCGETPPPKCKRHSCHLVARSNVPFCAVHACNEPSCNSEREEDKRYCSNHECAEMSCTVRRLCSPEDGVPQRFCEEHACFVCLMTDGTVAQQAEAEPPRNSCGDHPLCIGITARSQPCCAPSLPTSPYCGEHQHYQCSFVDQDGSRCNAAAVSRSIAYCVRHKPANPSNKVSIACEAVTKKKRPCKGQRLPNSRFCRDHIPLAWRSDGDAGKQDEPPSKASVDHTAGIEGIESDGQLSAKDDMEVVDEKAEVAELLGEEEAAELFGEEREGDEGARVDNIDEIDLDSEEEEDDDERGEIYAEEDEEEFMNEDLPVKNEIHEDEATLASAEGGPLMQHDHEFVRTEEWSWVWDTSQRIGVCISLLNRFQRLLDQWSTEAYEEMRRLRLEYREAEDKAQTKVYESCDVIGGTIVSCISRLDSIIRTNPFAVVVEEASEVAEPLLLCTLVPTCQKLEMIGDDRQLQASMQQKFSYERRNKVNRSLFERLNQNDADQTNILTVQRRMRRNVCDLIRDHYKDIVIIEDHASCATKKIGGDNLSLAEWEAGGREVPGVLPHIFLWTHDGSQTKSKVGLSRQNDKEVEMTINLVRYLVRNRVPKKSIAVLTPYKGQLKALQRELYREKIWVPKPSKHTGPRFRSSASPQDSCVLSTVDRFQGDEADIVIVSLVVDQHSRTPFVKLQNRMIVLLSRARLGLYLLGSMSNFHISNESLPLHWKATLNMLEHATKDDTATRMRPLVESSTTYEGARMGENLPICCPKHRKCSSTVSSSNPSFKMTCSEVCTSTLNCGHSCNLPCHFGGESTDRHQKRCEVSDFGPCNKHVVPLKCWKVMEQTKAVTLKIPFNAALARYRCEVQEQVPLPCSHPVSMTCADRSDCEQNQTWPVCTQPALEPVILPCLHELFVDCKDYPHMNARKDALQCQEKVNYQPPCGHEVVVTCHEKRMYSANPDRFVCQVQVNFTLPRCGHHVQLLCKRARDIQKQSGIAGYLRTFWRTAINVVEEGTSYGNPDYRCKEKVLFRARCGHEKTVDCYEAHEMVKNPPQCKEDAVSTNPACGHQVHVPCHQAQQFATEATTINPVERCSEGDHYDAHFNTRVRSRAACKSKVRFERSCSHVQVAACSEVQSWLMSSAPPACLELVEVSSPLCFHSFELPCHLQSAVSRWRPWQTNTGAGVVRAVELLRTEGIVLESVAAPTAQVPPLLKGHFACNRKLIVRRDTSCQHQVTLPCKEVFSFLNKKRKLPLCKETVEVQRLDCKHPARVQCCKQESDLPKCDNPTERPCSNMLCTRVVQQLCGATQAVCDGTYSFTCSTGKHSFKLSCSDGIPNGCRDCIADSLAAEYEACEIMCQSNELGRERPTCDNELLHKLMNAGDDMPLDVTNIDSYLQLKCQQLMKCREAFELRSRSWESHIPKRHSLPLFLPLDGAAFQKIQRGVKKERPIISSLAQSSPFGFAIQLYRISSRSLRAALQNNGQTTLCLAIGTSYSVLVPTEKHTSRTYKAANKWAREQRRAGYDSVSFYDEMYYWEPYCIEFLEIRRYSKESLASILESLDKQVSNMPCQSLKPSTLSLIPPNAHINEQSQRQKPLTDVDRSLLAFIGSAELCFPWDGLLLSTPSNDAETDSATENEVKTKCAFGCHSSKALQGISYLKSLTEGLPEAPLYLGLEYAAEGYFKDAEAKLDAYLKTSRSMHPLVLLLKARVERYLNRDFVPFLVMFKRWFPAAIAWMTIDERDMAKSTLDGGNSRTNNHTATSSMSVEDRWTCLKKERSRIHSKAMDELCKLTGLKKVKDAALRLLEAGMKLNECTPAMRADVLKSQTLNFVFSGNPGTGVVDIS